MSDEPANAPVDPKHVDELLRQLREGKLRQRLEAAWLLSQIQGFPLACIPAFIEAFGNDRSAPTAGNALLGLGEAAVQPLLDALNDPNPQIREKAHCLLGQLMVPEGRSWIEPVIKAIRGGARLDVKFAARFMATSDSETAVPRLAALLKDDCSECVNEPWFGR